MNDKETICPDRIAMDLAALALKKKEEQEKNPPDGCWQRLPRPVKNLIVYIFSGINKPICTEASQMSDSTL